MPDVLREKLSDAQACIDAGKAVNVGAARQNPHPHSKSYALVPKDHELVYLERAEFPLRRSGTVKLSDTASFLEYWKRQSNAMSYVYGSMEPAQFLAVFNEHHKGDSTENKSGADWRDHRALYTLAHSDEWTKWNEKDGQPFVGNETFAEWLEENLLDIKKPEPAKFMEIALNMRVQQGQRFGNKVNLTNGNMVLEYQNIVDGSSQSSAGAKIAIPEKFEISIPVFKGLDAKRYTIEARFRYRLVNGSLQLRFDLVRPVNVFEAAFKEMLADIEKAAKTKVLFGTPE